MTKYFIEKKGGDVVWGLLRDENGDFYNKYIEDSYICHEDGLSLTIKSSNPTSFWLIEEVKTNTKDNGGGLPIRNATKKGYLIAEEGDGIDLARRKGHRGTVQKGISQTIKSEIDVGVVVRE